MTEREDETREQHADDSPREPSQGGYPEENPTNGGEETGTSGREDERDTTPTDEPDSPSGASGEGTQSTGNPEAAG